VTRSVGSGIWRLIPAHCVVTTIAVSGPGIAKSEAIVSRIESSTTSLDIGALDDGASVAPLLLCENARLTPICADRASISSLSGVLRPEVVEPMADGEGTHVGGSLLEPGAIGVQSLHTCSDHCGLISR